MVESNAMINFYSGPISSNPETVTFKSNPVFSKCYYLHSVTQTEDWNMQLQQPCTLHTLLILLQYVRLAIGIDIDRQQTFPDFKLIQLLSSLHS